MYRAEGNSIRLPNELLLMVYGYLDGNETDSLSLAISGAFQGFASFHGKEREKHGLFISHKSFFLTPLSWKAYFSQHITPQSIIRFHANHCNWIPGDQLLGNILKMKNLVELGINDTKLSLSQLQLVLKTCQKITNLDFSYIHKRGMKNLSEITDPMAIAAFKKLRILKISTAVLDARDFINDPWAFIIKLLSFCQDCTELTVEVIYTGASCKYNKPNGPWSRLESEIMTITHDFHANCISWMKNLRSLVLIKLGPFKHSHIDNEKNIVHSRLLTSFLMSVFPELNQHRLVRLWIHDFCFHPGFMNHLGAFDPLMTTYRVNSATAINYFMPDFLAMEQLEAISYPLVHVANLLNLKSAHGIHYDSRHPNEILGFIGARPNLVHLSIFFDHVASPYIPMNAVYQLLKLKSFACSTKIIIKDMVDEFVLAYPNIEDLFLESTTMVAFRRNDTVISDKESLSAIKFGHLTSLTLQGFDLNNGASLISIATMCPKLESIHLMSHNHISSTSALSLNLDLFLEEAKNLKDFRMDVKLGAGYLSSALLLLKSFRTSASHLERISLQFNCQTLFIGNPDFDLADFLVQFILKMDHLTALCLVFYELDPSLIPQVHQRIVEEILPLRPALWFYLDRKLPNGVEPSVPAVHYRDMVLINNKFDPVPTF